MDEEREEGRRMKGEEKQFPYNIGWISGQNPYAVTVSN